jgi:hypothetical protein
MGKMGKGIHVSKVAPSKYKQLVDEKLKQGGPFFEFEGWNCHDADLECEGWDGMSSRCQCGNRRVSWVLTDDNSSVYGEAD